MTCSSKPDPYASADPAPGTTPGLDVLLVEFSRSRAIALAHLLLKSGLRVRVARSLDEALLRLEENASDAVVLDLELPDATGLEALSRIREHFGGVPVVIVTSGTGDEPAMEALKHGAQDYVEAERLEHGLLGRAVRYAVERHRSCGALAALGVELSEKNESLERLSEQKSQILGVVAHDLRNPLSVVRGYTDFLLSGVAGELTEEQADILRVVRRTAEYTLEMAEDLLDLARIHVGSLVLDRAPTDLAAVMREQVRVQAVLAREKNIEIVLTRGDDVGMLDLDEHKVRQVVENLLSNAMKFSPAGTRVEVELVREDGAARLCVRDQGVGMAKEDRERIFQPFQKSAARPTGGERSVGIGLTIVRNIVQAHGGRIWVESELGRGSTFYVELPAPSSRGER